MSVELFLHAGADGRPIITETLARNGVEVASLGSLLDSASVAAGLPGTGATSTPRYTAGFTLVESVERGAEMNGGQDLYLVRRSA